MDSTTVQVTFASADEQVAFLEELDAADVPDLHLVEVVEEIGQGVNFSIDLEPDAALSLASSIRDVACEGAGLAPERVRLALT